MRTHELPSTANMVHHIHPGGEHCANGVAEVSHLQRNPIGHQGEIFDYSHSDTLNKRRLELRPWNLPLPR